jgi:hypothetical protein
MFQGIFTQAPGGDFWPPERGGSRDSEHIVGNAEFTATIPLTLELNRMRVFAEKQTGQEVLGASG